MNKTRNYDRSSLIEQVTWTTPQLMQVTSSGRWTAIEIGMAAGARIQIGRRVMWNAQKVKDYLNKIAE